MRPFRSYYIPQYPLTAHIVGVMAICLLSSLAVAWRWHGRCAQETLVNTAVVLALLWSYFTCILYHGMRFDNGIVRWRRPRVELRQISQAVLDSGPDLSFTSFDAGASDGCLGPLLGLAISALIVIAVILLLYLGIEIGGFIAVLIAVPLYWLFRLSARLVVVNARSCAGNLPRALLTGGRYALL